MAFTFTETLSRVMMSCGGTSSTTVCNETLIIVSNGQKMRTRPGPLGCGDRRPSQKVTARSYSFSTLTHFKNRKTTMKRMAMIPYGMEPLPLRAGGWSPAGADRQGEIAYRDHLDRLSRGDRLLGDGVPDLALDEHLAAGRQRGAGDADLVDHGFDPGADRHALGAQGHEGQEADHQEGEGRHHGDQFHADPQRGLRGLEQHQGAEDEAEHARHPQHAVARDLDLQDEEDHREQ